VKLQHQPAQVLKVLLELPGEVVTREQLRQRLWPSDVFVDFDRSLNKAIVKLREVLGDSADSPRFIETLPKTGYRFIAPVSEPPPAVPAPSVAAPVPGLSFGRVVAIGLPLLLIAAVAVYFAFEKLVPARSASPVHSMVVLPLENQSGDPGQDYFADGMTDELITDLAKIGSLRVISRTTAMTYKGTRKPLPQIARELGVDAVVEGSVVRSASKVRIRAQLIRAASDEHIWANSYERNVSEAGMLQADIAQEIANEVRAQLSLRERTAINRQGTANPAAYEAFLKGRFFFNKRTLESAARSVEYYRQAIALDSNYAAAYSGLSDSLAVESYMGAVPAADVMPEARSAAMKAVALDDNLADAHISVSSIYLTYDFDWLTAKREIERALELNPNSASAHQSLAEYLVVTGRTDEAVLEGQRARELDPLSSYVNRDLGRYLYYARRYDDAEKQLLQTLDLDPGFGRAVWEWIGWCKEKQGQQSEAVDDFLKMLEADNTDAATLKALKLAYERRGWKAFWREEIQRNSRADSYFVALAYAKIGDKKQALEVLQRVISRREVRVLWMGSDPQLDSLRSDPRFQKLLQGVGLVSRQNPT
jgi:TolB-like protein/Tfp pilus assembly protein PilF